mgnify:CR=1 FL=1
MNLEDNNIDELFKEHLGNEPVAFDESAWEQAQGMIAKPKRKVFPLFWRVTSMVSLIFLILAAFYFGLRSTPSGNSANNLTETESNSSNSTQVTMNDNSEKALPQIEENNTTIENEMEVPDDKDVSESLSIADASTNPNQISSPGNKLTDKAPELGSGRYNPPSKPAPKQPEEPIPTSPKSDTTQLGAPMQPEVLEIKPQVNYPKLEASFLSAIQINEIPYSNSLNKSKLEYIDLKTDYIFNWGVSVFSGVGSTNKNTISTSIGDFSEEHTEKYSRYNGVGVFANYSNIGLSVSLQQHKYEFTDRTEGFGYTQEYDTSYSLKNKNVQDSDNDYNSERTKEIRTRLPIWEISEDIDSTAVQSTEREVKSTQNVKVQYFQIPIELSYRFNLTRRLSLDPSFGVRIGIPASITGNYYDIENESLKSFSKTNLTTTKELMGGLGINYYITSRILAGAEVKYIYNRETISGLNSSILTNRINGQVGIKFLLR